MKTEQPSDAILFVVRSPAGKFFGEYFFDNDLIGTLITPGTEMMTNAETELVPIEFKSDPSYVEHTIQAETFEM